MNAPRPRPVSERVDGFLSNLGTLPQLSEGPR